MKNDKQTINLEILRRETANYLDHLPVFIRVGEKEYPIDDIFWCAEPDSSNSRIVIETWQIETPATMGKKGGKVKKYQTDEERRQARLETYRNSNAKRRIK